MPVVTRANGRRVSPFPFGVNRGMGAAPRFGRPFGPYGRRGMGAASDQFSASIDVTASTDAYGNTIMPNGDGTFSTYDSNGNLVATYDGNGNLLSAVSMNTTASGTASVPMTITPTAYGTDSNGNTIVPNSDGTFTTYDATTEEPIATYDSNGNYLYAGQDTSAASTAAPAALTGSTATAVNTAIQNPSSGTNLVSLLTGSGLNLNQAVSTIASLLNQQSAGTAQAAYLQQQLALAKTQTVTGATTSNTFIVVAGVAVVAWLIFRKK